MYLVTKHIDRNSQSIVMATQTPNTPISKYTPSTTLNPIRNIHIERMDIPIVNFTSAAALRVFGREKDRGQIVTTQAEW